MARSAVAWLRNDLRLRDNERGGSWVVLWCIYSDSDVTPLLIFIDPWVPFWIFLAFCLAVSDCATFNARVLQEEQAHKFALKPWHPHHWDSISAWKPYLTKWRPKKDIAPQKNLSHFALIYSSEWIDQIQSACCSVLTTLCITTKERKVAASIAGSEPWNIATKGHKEIQEDPQFYDVLWCFIPCTNYVNMFNAYLQLPLVQNYRSQLKHQ